MMFNFLKGEINMYCKNCGKEIPEGVRFCPECGADQEAASQNGPANTASESNDHAMGIVAYITWIGFIIAICAARRNEYTNFHLNQALVINLFMLVGWIPVVGWIWDIFMFVCWIIALVGACNDECRPIPLLGNIVIIK